jgi:hypothetical protein
LRSLFGRPCRKIEVHTCVSVSQFQNLTGALSFGSTVFVSAIFGYQLSAISYQLSALSYQLSAISSLRPVSSELKAAES